LTVAFAVRRLGAAVLTIVLVLTITFALAQLAPGEPMLAEAERLRADPARVARVRAEFGLDRPLAQQYAHYVGNALRGNLGESFTMRRPVADVLAERLPRTALLAGVSLLVAFALGIGIAALQAARAGSWEDGALGAATLVFYSTPAFWLGLVLLVVFGQWLGWFPVGGMTTAVEHARMGPLGRLLDIGRHLALPALTLALVQTAEVARYQRGALVDALGAEYVRAARARGLGDWTVLTRHALRSALAPVVTLAGLSVPALLAGAVLVESVFSWPGMGRLTYDAILTRDYNLILAASLVSGALVALGSLAADLAAHALDPRTAP
jgi:peptide/nickel transport system permease protein